MPGAIGIASLASAAHGTSGRGRPRLSAPTHQLVGGGEGEIRHAACRQLVSSHQAAGAAPRRQERGPGIVAPRRWRPSGSPSRRALSRASDHRKPSGPTTSTGTARPCAQPQHGADGFCGISGALRDEAHYSSLRSQPGGIWTFEIGALGGQRSRGFMRRAWIIRMPPGGGHPGGDFGRAHKCALRGHCGRVVAWRLGGRGVPLIAPLIKGAHGTRFRAVYSRVQR